MPDDTFGIKIDNQLLYEETLIENKNFVELHNWQREGIKYFFNNGCKAIFNAATGTGKTVFAISILKEILKKNPDSRILIVVPKNIIMETGWYQELYNHGFNLQDIGVFYGNIKELCKITITNMQSIEKIPLELYNVAILDECFAGNTILKIKYKNKIKKIKIKTLVEKKLKCKVLSYNIKNKKIEYQDILEYYKIKNKQKLIKITLENNKTLLITPEQLIYNGKKYIKAQNFKIGDEVLCK